MAEILANLGVPVVDLMSDLPQMDLPAVGLDHQKIAELAANHLWECGFRSFAYCGIRGSRWPQQRHEYFCKTIKEFECDLHVHWLPTRNSKAWSSEIERERLTQWITDLPKPVGIMACNDVTGQRVLEACRQACVMVPEQAAVIGVDNDEAFCRIADPMLSSIVPGHDRVGFHGAELLDQLMCGKRPPHEPLVVGLPRVIVRQSTDIQMVSDNDVAMALRFIREQACSGISVREVAAHVALSYSTLNRRFHSFLSRSIHDEITRIRLKRVRELLSTTQLTVPQIAQLTGFKHSEYLGAIFKSKTGITPGQFRERLGSPIDSNDNLN